MSQLNKGHRVMVTISDKNYHAMEKNIADRGLIMSKSGWISLAIEHELNTYQNDDIKNNENTTN